MAAIDFKQPKGIDFLGYLCYNHLRQQSYPAIENKFIDAGIDIRYMPNKIKAVVLSVVHCRAGRKPSAIFWY